MSRPRVSVGMPVYNSARFIETALEGVLAQTFRDFELVISDNASTDASPEICARYASRDSRIHFVRNDRNRGASYNFNRVFELSGGEYFLWASSNDWLAPSFLEKAVAVLDSSPDVVLCCSRTRYFEGSPERFTEVDDPMDITMESPIERFDELLRRIGINNVMHGLIRTDELRRTRLVDSFFRSDILMVAELALAGKIRQLPEPLFYRRMEEDAATIMMNAAQVRYFWNAAGGAEMRLQNWKLQRAYWSLLLRARLGLADRARLAVLLAKRSYWELPRLLADLREVLRSA